MAHSIAPVVAMDAAKEWLTVPNAVSSPEAALIRCSETLLEPLFAT